MNYTHSPGWQKAHVRGGRRCEKQEKRKYLLSYAFLAFHTVLTAASADTPF